MTRLALDTVQVICRFNCSVVGYREVEFWFARYSSAAKSLTSGRVLFCRRLCRHEQRIQPGAVEQFACNNNGINLL